MSVPTMNLSVYAGNVTLDANASGSWWSMGGILDASYYYSVSLKTQGLGAELVTVENGTYSYNGQTGPYVQVNNQTAGQVTFDIVLLSAFPPTTTLADVQAFHNTKPIRIK